MKRILSFISALALCAGAYESQAQSSYDFGGAVIDQSAVSAMDLFNLSQTQFAFGTARSAAMAGAFTSLGADLASMSVNPAGMGMYRHNEMVITPMLSFGDSRTTGEGFERTNTTNVGVGNIGFVLKLRESATGVTAINLGFGYNRLADFNRRYSTAVGGQNASMADLFARQLGSNGITSAYLKGDTFGWGRIDPALWGASLGYFTGMVSDGSGKWDRDMIASPSVGQFATVKNSGSAGEYLVSLGLNFNNKVYFGASLGIQSIYMRRDVYYGENYRYDAEPALDYRMDYVNYDQSSRISGAGVNLKLGVIYRPIEGLRLGFAFHTPTYYTMTYKYRAGMTSRVKSQTTNPDGYTLDHQGYINPPFSESTPQLVDNGPDSWDFISPARMLFGASYTLGQFAVISVDYERDWYNGIRVKGSPYGKRLFDDFARENYKGSNTLRIGAEVRIIPQLALRAGYGLWSGGLKDKHAIFSSPVIYRTDYVGAGLGIALSKAFFIDVAYPYTRNLMTDYKMFYYYGNGEDEASPTLSTKLLNHSVMLTLGFRF